MELGPGLSVVVFGLAAALSWGAGDFGGGFFARRQPLFGVVLVMQATGLAITVALALLNAQPLPSLESTGWALLTGCAGVVGVTSLYRGLAEGRMGVVAPIAGVIGAIVPVCVGFAFQAVPRMAAIIGIGLALVSVILVTRAPGHHGDRPSGWHWGLIAGIATGISSTAISRIGPEAMYWSLATVRSEQILGLVVIAAAWRQPWRVGRGDLWRLGVAGALDMAGNVTYVIATQSGMLAAAAVLSSLYPVGTVLLAIGLLRERVTRSHVLGIAVAVLAIALIALGSGAG